MRDRILYGLVVFAILLIGFSLALGQLSFAEQSRISANFGLTAIHISCVILAIFLGSTLVAREMDKKTILTLLARPITRLEFLLGKALGLSSVIVVVMLGLSTILTLVFTGMNVSIEFGFLISLLGIFFECLVLMGFALFFSTLSRPVLVVCFCIGIFMIGHWLGSLDYFAAKSGSEVFGWMSKITSIVIPDLESFNWRSLPVYEETLALPVFFTALIYAFSWFGFLLVGANLILRRKDLG